MAIANALQEQGDSLPESKPAQALGSLITNIGIRVGEELDDLPRRLLHPKLSQRQDGVPTNTLILAGKRSAFRFTGSFIFGKECSSECPSSEKGIA